MAVKRRKLTTREQAKVSRKIRFLRKKEGLGQKQAVGKAIGIIKQQSNKRKRRAKTSKR